MENIKYSIEILDPAIWRGYILDFAYTSDYYYDVEVNHKDERFEILFTKKQFPKTFVNSNVTYDVLYQPHWNGATAYGIVENGCLIAAIETWVEEWSNRLRVTEMWVHADYRRQGIGAELMRIAKRQAIQEKRRAVILETQSCNTKAIAFYMSQEFKIIGFDTCCYSNNDIERREVRMEMGFIIT